MRFIVILAGLLAGITTPSAQDATVADAPFQALLERHDTQTAAARKDVQIADIYHAGSILFLKGGAGIDDQGTDFLDVLAAALATDEMADVGLILTAHASRDGAPEDNLALTERRTAAVTDYLVDVGNLANDRISGKSHGDTAPLVDIDPEDPQQRRVEVYVVYRVPVAGEPETLDLPQGLVLTRHGAGTSPFDATLLFDLDTSDPNGATLPLDRYGTIEFWVRPAEAPAPGNESAPVLLALHGEEQVKLSIQMPRENDRLIIWDGTNETGLADVAYAFTQGTARHVALATLEGRSSLYIDGRHRGTFDTGYGAGLSGQLVVGALNAANELAFEGDIGGVRLWRRALNPAEIATLPETTGDPSPSSAVYDDLIAHASPDGTALLVPEPAIRLDLSAWKLFGSDNFSVRNKAAYTTSAIFSDHPPHRRDAADTSADPDVRSEHIAFLKQHMNDPERAFSSYPLYIIRQVPADRFGFAATPVPGFSGTTSAFELAIINPADSANGLDLPERATPNALFFETDRAGFRRIRINFWDRDIEDRTHKFPGTEGITGSSMPGNFISEDRRIVGFSGRADIASGRIVSLTVYANDGPISTWKILTGPDPETATEASRDRQLRAFSQFLETGVPFAGFDFLSDTDGYLTSIAIKGDQDTARASVIVTLEDGRSERFARIARNVYQSSAERSILSKVARPKLTIAGSELIAIEGLPIDVVPVHPHETPRGENSSFDNVFIVQSKAVNLESSYDSYDITAMDPIHLTESGTNRRVFAMPDPASNDYYDANRIFVPRGLHYVPEFTGDQHTKTHVVSSMSDFQNASAHNVSAGGSIGPVAFSRSESHKKTSRVVRGKNRSMTLGISKAMFYDLVLDKARMKLDRQFVSRIERLKTNSTVEDYDRFVEAYGTHYPSAVIYGGMGVLQMEYSGTKIGRMASSETDIAYSAQLTLSRQVTPKSGGKPTTQQLGSAQFGTSSNTGSGSSFEQEMGDQFENFYFVGGAHVGLSKDSWGVGLDGVVPVHVNLRPLEELLAPPFFNDPIISFDVRPRLKAAIERYIRNAGGELGGDVNTMPRLYRLTLLSLKPSKWITKDEDEAALPNADETATDFLELGGKITVDSGLESEHESQRKRLFVDLEQPHDFTLDQGFSNLDVRDSIPFNRRFTAADSGDGSLSHVIAVDPCVIELGGAFEIDIDLREYDRRSKADPMTRTVQRQWTDVMAADQTFSGGLKKNQFSVRVKGDVPQRPELDGCVTGSRDVNECYDFRLVFDLTEVGSTLGTPAQDPACPATLDAFNAVAEKRLTGGQ